LPNYEQTDLKTAIVIGARRLKEGVADIHPLLYNQNS
jgi:hypothetical protein